MITPPKLLIATTNRKKGEEMAQILGAANLDVEIATLAEFPDAPPVAETGATFMENASLKAVAAVTYSGLVSIADDAGKKPRFLRMADCGTEDASTCGVLACRFRPQDFKPRASTFYAWREPKGANSR